MKPTVKYAQVRIWCTSYSERSKRGRCSITTALEYTIRSNKLRKDWNSMEHINSWPMLTMLIYWVKT